MSAAILAFQQPGGHEAEAATSARELGRHVGESAARRMLSLAAARADASRLESERENFLDLLALHFNSLRDETGSDRGVIIASFLAGVQAGATDWWPFLSPSEQTGTAH